MSIEGRVECLMMETGQNFTVWAIKAGNMCFAIIKARYYPA
ncbi:hypothetical protein [Pedobacter sp. W3I1]|nr:hypothetical protein [Pedobacter sp. W3I1]